MSLEESERHFHVAVEEVRHFVAELFLTNDVSVNLFGFRRQLSVSASTCRNSRKKFAAALRDEEPPLRDLEMSNS